MKDKNLQLIECLMEYVPFPNQLYKIDQNMFSESLLNYMADKVTFIHELSSIMELPEILDFLYVFSGKTIIVPDAKTIRTAIRDLDIFFCLDKKDEPQEVARLAQKYGITQQAISSIRSKVIQKLNHKNID